MEKEYSPHKLISDELSKREYIYNYNSLNKGNIKLKIKNMKKF